MGVYMLRRRHNVVDMQELWDGTAPVFGAGDSPWMLFPSRPVAAPPRVAVVCEEKVSSGRGVKAGAGAAYFTELYAKYAARQKQLREEGKEIVFDPVIGADVVVQIDKRADAAADSRVKGVSGGSSIERGGPAGGVAEPVKPAECGWAEEDEDEEGMVEEDVFAGFSPEGLGRR
ncbi:MAG: hypothetical protein A3C55_06800 [Gammaproteobacteria bacterium RIFCSPHIGHO2_02_FULL_42_13]|nr:MAG: hypothetical protein A3C55_06800 [Gammaproteobacteria bacterium RIFCSPHIGHO2_02_FULL_42_13]